jgi:hypothetical protein
VYHLRLYHEETLLAKLMDWEQVLMVNEELTILLHDMTCAHYWKAGSLRLPPALAEKFYLFKDQMERFGIVEAGSTRGTWEYLISFLERENESCEAQLDEILCQLRLVQQLWDVD